MIASLTTCTSQSNQIVIRLSNAMCLRILFSPYPLQEHGLGHDCVLDDVRQPESSEAPQPSLTSRSKALALALGHLMK
jgi:hypothetical protein